jgi:hypothetical protein
LDFHHTDPRAKEFKISQMRTIPRLKAEIAKCIVICANCHRKGHKGFPRPEHVGLFCVPAALSPCSDATTAVLPSGTNAAQPLSGGTTIACAVTAENQ